MRSRKMIKINTVRKAFLNGIKYTIRDLMAFNKVHTAIERGIRASYVDRGGNKWITYVSTHSTIRDYEAKALFDYCIKHYIFEDFQPRLITKHIIHLSGLGIPLDGIKHFIAGLLEQ